MGGLLGAENTKTHPTTLALYFFTIRWDFHFKREGLEVINKDFTLMEKTLAGRGNRNSQSTKTGISHIMNSFGLKRKIVGSFYSFIQKSDLIKHNKIEAVSRLSNPRRYSWILIKY